DRSGQLCVVRHGPDHPSGQRAIAGVGEKGAFSDHRKLVPAQFLIGMKFGNGHVSGAVSSNGFATKCIARIYTGSRVEARQFTALVYGLLLVFRAGTATLDAWFWLGVACVHRTTKHTTDKPKPTTARYEQFSDPSRYRTDRTRRARLRHLFAPAGGPHRVPRHTGRSHGGQRHHRAAPLP